MRALMVLAGILVIALLVAWFFSTLDERRHQRKQNPIEEDFSPMIERGQQA